MEIVLKYMCLLQEKVRPYKVPVSRARILMGVPQPRESQAQTKTTARGVSASWSCRGTGKRSAAPNSCVEFTWGCEEMSLRS